MTTVGFPGGDGLAQRERDGRPLRISVGNRRIKVVESGVSSRTLSVAADKFL